MKPPCIDCLTLAICRVKVKEPRWTIVCPLVNKYVNGSLGQLQNERPRHRQNRINKVRKALGLRKSSNKWRIT